MLEGEFNYLQVFLEASSVQPCHSLYCSPHYRIPLAFGSSVSFFRVVVLCFQRYTQKSLGNTSRLRLRGSNDRPRYPEIYTKHFAGSAAANDGGGRGGGQAFPLATDTNSGAARSGIGGPKLDPLSEFLWEMVASGRDPRDGEKLEKMTESPSQEEASGNNISFQNCFYTVSQQTPVCSWSTNAKSRKTDPSREITGA